MATSFGVVGCQVLGHNCPYGRVPPEACFVLLGLPVEEFLFHVSEFVADLLLVIWQPRIPTTLVHIPPPFLTWTLFTPVVLVLLI